MGIRTIFVRMFVCQCNTNYGVRNLHQYIEGNKIVGRCLKCNRRVYGRIYNNKNDAILGLGEKQ